MNNKQLGCTKYSVPILSRLGYCDFWSVSH